MTEHKEIRYKHHTPIQIRFNDIDQLAHVNNSVYQQFFDWGRMNYFKEVLKEKMDWNVEGLILASISIDFLNSIEMYDEVEVHTMIYHIGNKSVKMSQELYNKTKKCVAATSKSVMVNFSNTSKSTLVVPERWRKNISDYEHEKLFEV